MNKIYIALAISLFSTLTNAENCQFEWDLSASGIRVGQAIDKLEFNDKHVKVESIFNIYPAFKIFGVKNIQRFYISSNTQPRIQTRESQVSDNPNTIEWDIIGRNYTQRVNGKTEKTLEFESTPSIPSVDSTIFPYSILTKLIKPLDTQNIRVLNKTFPYDAVVEFKNKNNINELIFMNNNSKKGIVEMDKDYYPSSFTFTDNNTTVVAKLLNKSCNLIK